MPNIDNLDIQISASANDAAVALNNLASTFKRVGSIANASGGGMKSVPDKMEEVGSKTEKATKEVRKFSDTLKSCISRSNSFGKSFSGLASGIKRIGSGLLSTTRGLSTLPKLFGGTLVNGIKNAVGHFGNLFNAIKRIAFYRAIRSAIKYITAGFKEGLENLYAWSQQADQRFSRTMDNLATSSLYLKNSLAAMAAPLIQAVAPAIDFIVDKLVSLFNFVNQFIAQLTGQKTYTVAKRVATVWGDAADGASKKTGDSLKNVKETVKELKKTILAFDEINKLEKQDTPGSTGGSGGSGGSGKADAGVSAADMFITKPVTGSMNGLMEKLKDIWGVFKKAWAQEGAATIAAAKAALNSLKGAAVDIGNTFYDVFTSGYGFNWVVSGLHVLQSLLGVVTSISEAFRTAWNDDNRGFNYISSIFTMLTNVNELIANIGKSFSDAFNNGIGVQIWQNLLDIATNYNNIIGNLAGAINTAWTTSAHGTSIWAAVFAIVNSVLETVNDITSAVAEWAANLDFEPVLSAFEELLGAIKPVIDTLSNGLFWAYENVLLPVGKWTIESGLPAIIGLLSAAFGLLSSVLNALKEPAKFIWDNFLEPVGKWVADTAITAINGLSNALSGISTWIDEHQEAFATITGLIGTFIGSWLGATAVEGIITGIATAATTLSGVLPLLASGFSPVRLAIMAVILVGTWLVSHWEDIQKKFAEIGAAIVGVAQEVGADIQAFWEDCKAFFDDMGEEIKAGLTLLKDTFGPIWEDVKAGVTNVAKWLKDGLSGVVSWVKTTFTQGWRTAWNSVVTTFGNLFAKIKDKVKAPINAVINMVNSMIDAIESGINWIIGGINNIRITIPGVRFDGWNGIIPQYSADYEHPMIDVGPSLSTVSWGRVKPLAKGGIIDKKMLLGIMGNSPIVGGEAGREAVLPLDQNTDWMDVLAAKISGNSDNNYMLAEYVRSGVQDATHQQNELLREQNNILRQLLDKPVTAEISTNGIINGLIRKNQRDGTTIVPVNG